MVDQMRIPRVVINSFFFFFPPSLFKAILKPVELQHCVMSFLLHVFIINLLVISPCPYLPEFITQAVRPGLKFRLTFFFFFFPRSVTNRPLVFNAHASPLHAYSTWNLQKLSS